MKYVLDKLISVTILDLDGNVISIHPGKEPMSFDGSNYEESNRPILPQKPSITSTKLN